MSTIRELLRGYPREYELLRRRAYRNFRSVRDEVRAIILEALQREYDSEPSERPLLGAEPESPESKER